MNKIKYYLSFDCATKTFTYVLVKVNHTYLSIDFKSIMKCIHLFDDNVLNKINYIADNTIQIMEAKCIDLFPNVSNKTISTVDRIKRMVEYVKANIYPKIQDIDKDDIVVIIEFQMSHNTQSKVIAISLITLFTDYNVQLIHPTLKNKVALSNEGNYAYFIEKYNNNYTANKEHALYNFKLFEITFNQYQNYSNTMKKNIADAFLQIFGLILYSTSYKV